MFVWKYYFVSQGARFLVINSEIPVIKKIFVKMAWQDNGPGGGRAESATKDPEASESLLEEVTVTSPDSPDDQGHQDGEGHAGQTEDQPLINRTAAPTVIKPTSSASGTPKFQPKSFRRQSQGLPATPTISSKPQITSSSLELDRPTIPIMINLDPSERVLLNAGKKKTSTINYYENCIISFIHFCKSNR